MLIRRKNFHEYARGTLENISLDNLSFFDKEQQELEHLWRNWRKTTTNASFRVKFLRENSQSIRAHVRTHAQWCLKC